MDCDFIICDSELSSSVAKMKKSMSAAVSNALVPAVTTIDDKYIRKIKISLNVMIKLNEMVQNTVTRSSSSYSSSSSSSSSTTNAPGNIEGSNDFEQISGKLLGVLKGNEVFVFEIIPVVRVEGKISLQFEVESMTHTSLLSKYEVVGWYHSHNFSNNFMSNLFFTQEDVVTQAAYQCYNGTFKCFVGATVNMQ